ncbi:unnamed protein product [Bursaphelenchus xylophilus]|uniref:(pine wood nematode) hypothetical protein n=1 Tax=Bursaphelenchus xylophilus TaxID=6326 RepID=A0A7I8XCY8_BURXY|nr:unnamed protein product [Bursaphelenchus xylophilus]CAG9131669.1 unnamed protein product [Bursaphelenchus xylophilus]
MAEFAEESLEKLLPAFEVVSHSKLIAPEHVKEFINRCKRFEYRFQKRVKRENDWNDYIKYLKGFLTYWKIKLDEANLAIGKNVVYVKIQKKIAWLYRTRSQRSGRLDHYLEEARYCARFVVLYKDASIAYGKMLQIHNTKPELFAEAAEFESKKNNSAPNARTLVQIGLRKFPDSAVLYKELFTTECRFVQYIRDRRDILLGQDVKARNLERPEGAVEEDEPTKSAEKPTEDKTDGPSDFVSRDDKVLNLELVRIVLDEAEKTLAEEEKPDFHEECYKISRRYPAVKEVSGELAKLVEEDKKKIGKKFDPENIEEDGGDVDEEDLFFEDAQPEKSGEIADAEDAEVHEEGDQSLKSSKTWEPLPEIDEEAVKKMLARAVVDDDYDKKAIQEIQKKSARQQKRERKAERESTKGKGWFNLPATELTEETKRDLELLQIRGSIDPTAHYRKNDLKVLPKYFQTGRVIDSHADFYSSRMTKKERKQTMVEELMDDYKTLQKNKKRYSEIKAVEAQTRKRKGIPFQRFSKRKKNPV